MQIKPIHGIITVIALLILMYFIQPFYQIVYGIIKSMFEGNSFGKMLLFFAWLLVFFVLLLLKEKKIIKVNKIDSKKLLKYFAIIIISSWTLAFLLNTAVLAMHNTSLNGVIGTLSSENGVIEWEASLAKHLHSAKISLGLINSLLPSQVMGADSGLPLYRIIPFSWLFGIVFICFAIAALIIALKEALNNFEKTISVRNIVWAIASYGLLVSILDGGFLTGLSRIGIGLALFYWIAFESNLKLRPLFQFFAPMILLGGFYCIISYFTSFSFTAEFRVGLVGAIIALCLIKMNWQNKNFNKTIWTIVFILLAMVTSFSIIDYGFGYFIPKNVETNYYVYGLPENTTANELTDAFSEFGTVTKIEKNGWIALLSFKAKKDFRTEEVNQVLKEKLKPKTYLYAFAVGKEKRDIIINWPNDEKTINALLTIKSEYVSFRKENIFGTESLVMTTLINDNYSVLYVLDYLYFKKGIKNPVVTIS